jgi:hypothetical protein
MKKCKHCGEDFIPQSLNREYCIDNACNDKYYEELNKNFDKYNTKYNGYRKNDYNRSS